MNTMTKAQTATLPVTGREVPEAVTDYSLKGYRSMRTTAGLADTANLYRGTRKVATIHQGGNGGMTYARFDDVAEQARFEQAADGDVETTLDALMLEALATREVKKHARKYLLVVAAGDDATDYKAFPPMVMNGGLREALTSKFGAGTRYWDTDQAAWVTV